MVKSIEILDITWFDSLREIKIKYRGDDWPKFINEFTKLMEKIEWSLG